MNHNKELKLEGKNSKKEKVKRPKAPPMPPSKIEKQKPNYKQTNEDNK